MTVVWAKWTCYTMHEANILNISLRSKLTRKMSSSSELNEIKGRSTDRYKERKTCKAVENLYSLVTTFHNQ